MYKNLRLIDFWNRLGFIINYEVLKKEIVEDLAYDEQLIYYKFSVIKPNGELHFTENREELLDGFAAVLSLLDKQKDYLLKLFHKEATSSYLYFKVNGYAECRSHLEEKTLEAYINVMNEENYTVEYTFDSCIFSKI